MAHWGLIALAGALGTLGRAGLGAALATASWPVYTWLANVVGSFAIAAASELLGGVQWAGVDAKPIVTTGLLGGFTTYSAFNLETLRMLQGSEWGKGALYLVGTVVSCVAAGLLGLWLGRLVNA